MPVVWAAIDVGGTFTDCLIMDSAGALRAYKAPSTPHDPSQGLLDALEKGAQDRDQTLEQLLSELNSIIHGTTLATNALLTGKGANVGMLTTRGFRDVIETRRGQKNVRTSMYDLFVPPYRPLVSRNRRLGVRERTLHDGSVLHPLDESDVRAAVEQLAASDVDAIAVCFLHSYANGTHEARAAQLVQERLNGDVYVVTSHEILPIAGEYERFSTSVVSAYVGPIIATYLEQLERRLSSLGFRGSLQIVQSDGLVQSAEASRRLAVALVSSGPAAAPTAASWTGQSIGVRDLISVDMGGTSFDVCLMQGGEIPTTTEGWVGDERVAIKMIDISTVGAGGGSIGWIDALGLLRVGPQSAGAAPGPACYRRGGHEPTVTDADVVLGYVPTDYFLGGEIVLDRDLALSAMRRLGEQLSLDEIRTAEAMFKTVNALMADQITELSTKRGLDTRDYALVVGGGAGPVHAAHIAESLDIPTVIVPRYSALYSAFGMFAMDIGRAYVSSYLVRASNLDLSRLADLYAGIERQAIEELASSHVDPSALTFSRTADMRYVGQYHEVEVPLAKVPETIEDIDQIVSTFHVRHRELYGFDLPFREVEFLFFRLKASVKKPPLRLSQTTVGDCDPTNAYKRTRACFFDGIWVETPCYDGDRLQAGNVVNGPAIVEEKTTSLVIPPRFACTVDRSGAYVLRRDHR